METRGPKSVLLLEPCAWRYDSIARFLRGSGIEVTDAPAGADVAMVARPLVSSRGPELYPLIDVLVHGETACLTDVADLLADGAHGYFELTSPQEQLLEALRVIAGGGFWAPRAAVVQMVQQQQRPRPDDVDREDRVLLGLLLEGLGNKEIASRLGVAEVTVKARLTRLYKRHGVKTRLQLLSSAIRQHLVDLAP